MWPPLGCVRCSNSTLTDLASSFYLFPPFLSNIYCNPTQVKYFFKKVKLTNGRCFCYNIINAGVAELADAPDLGSGISDVQVQVLSPAPYYDVTLIAVRREKSPRFLGDFSLFCTIPCFLNGLFRVIEPHIFIKNKNFSFSAPFSRDCPFQRKIRNWCEQT